VLDFRTNEPDARPLVDRNLAARTVEEVLVEGHPSSADLDDDFFESIAESSGHKRDFQRSIVGNEAELTN
jgi:hypothetical protein